MSPKIINKKAALLLSLIVLTIAIAMFKYISLQDDKSINSNNIIVDTSKISTLLDTAGVYLNTNPTITLANASQALELARDINFQRGVAKALGTQGLAQVKMAHYKDAHSSLLESERIYNELGDKRNAVNARLAISSMYNYMDNAYMAFQENIVAEKYLYEVNDSDLIVAFKINEGQVYLDRAYYDDALKAFAEAKAIASKRKTLLHLGITNGGIAKSYYYQKQYDSSLKYFHLALQMDTIANNQTDLAGIYNGLATVYITDSNYIVAKDLLLKSMTISRTIYDYRVLMSAFYNYSDLNIQMNDLHTAKIYSDSLTEYATALSDLTMQKAALILQSKIYDHKGEYKLAFNSINSALSIDSTIASEDVIKRFNSAKLTHEFELTQIAQKEANAAHKQKENKLYYIIRLIIAFALISVLIVISSVLLKSNQPILIFLLKSLVLILLVALTIILNQITSKFYGDVFSQKPILMLLVLTLEYYVIQFLHKKLISILIPQKT